MLPSALEYIFKQLFLIFKMLSAIRFRKEKSRLEKLTNKSVSFNAIYGWEVEKGAKSFEQMYQESRKDLDNFERQFALIKRINFVGTFFDVEVPLAEAEFPDNMKLYLNHVDNWYNILPHELAHFWHYHLNDKDKFESEWKDISGNCYGVSPSEVFLDIAGVVSKYAITNLLEDVAETAQFAFFTKMGQYKKSNFLTSHNMEKIAQKINLLKMYEFISEKEHEILIPLLVESQDIRNGIIKFNIVKNY